LKYVKSKVRFVKKTKKIFVTLKNAKILLVGGEDKKSEKKMTNSLAKRTKEEQLQKKNHRD